jgi:N-carbamoylputrescine amidase
MGLFRAERLESPARRLASTRKRTTLALIQEKWHGSQSAQMDELASAAKIATTEGAELIAFSELTLYPYVCEDARGPRDSIWKPEPEVGGVSVEWARSLSRELQVSLIISFYEEIPGEDLGYNTALTLNGEGEVILKTRKTHLPITAGYFEDKWFKPSPGDAAGTAEVSDLRLGTPTCWDQWFPELARIYGLRETELIIYPTAIGSEPEFPTWDTANAWRSMMIGHAISNGLFVAAVNRYGREGLNIFYGSSFVADPYGRVMVEGPRDESAILIAELDLDMRRDWLAAFPLIKTRRPDVYRPLLNEEME